MGNGTAKETVVGGLQVVTTEEPATTKTHAKVLLLSGPQAGKTTIFKQFILAYGRGFTDKERSEYIPTIIANIVQGAQYLLNWAEQLGLRLSPNTEASAEHVRKMSLDVEMKEMDIQHLERLWEDDALHEAYSKLDRSQVQESASYFLNRVRVVTNAGYVPNDQDLLRVRLRTTGVIESKFDVPESPVLLVDVGGERNERKKWIHCFESVDAIIYVCPISDYNRVLFEDGETNRLVEHLNIFEELMSSRWFNKTLFILLFTKRDIFEKNFDKNVLNMNFPDFTGSTIEDGYKFIEELFKSKTSDPGRITLVERMNAVDSDDFMAVMEPIKHLLKKALNTSTSM